MWLWLMSQGVLILGSSLKPRTRRYDSPTVVSSRCPTPATLRLLQLRLAEGWLCSSPSAQTRTRGQTKRGADVGIAQGRSEKNARVTGVDWGALGGGAGVWPRADGLQEAS